MITRRQLLTRTAGVAAATLARPLIGNLSAAAPIEPATTRTPALARYEELQFGVSYHFSMNTFTGDDYETGKVPVSTYNPTKLDVRQWIRVATEIGTHCEVSTA